MYKFLISVILLFGFDGLWAQSGRLHLWGEVRDGRNGEQLGFATVGIALPQGGPVLRTVADEKGVFCFRDLQPGSYRLQVSFLGYRGMELERTLLENDTLRLELLAEVKELAEVVVTATEAREAATTSKIDRGAMRHRQPSSFGDLLSLLPGGMSSVPALGTAAPIRLRQAGHGGEDYDITSLGTAFLIDNHRMATDANMQSVPQSSAYEQLEYAGKGVDMRTISTDQIENVEIVRGLASVEYGDLTSGLVKIQRKLGFTPWEARFKADQYAKLFSLGKGTEWKQRQFSLNGGLDYVDARPDPRDDYSTYKRLTGSLRLEKKADFAGMLFHWWMIADYTGSFDNRKSDPEVDLQQEDSYRSSYQALAWGNTLSWKGRKEKGLKQIELVTTLRFQRDRIGQTKFVQLDRDRVVPNSLEAGEHDAEILPYKYVASLTVDGQPFMAAAKLKANWEVGTQQLNDRIMAGVEWQMDKNYGRGQVYDLNRPLNPTTAFRPTVFRDIPAGHKFSFFVENQLSFSAGRQRWQVKSGLRGTTLWNLSSRYRMYHRVYADPRFSVLWEIPAAGQPQKWSIALAGSIGWQTKMPTLQQLHPYRYYHDITQLNYWHLNPEYRRVQVLTCITDPANEDLKPARNRKWEVKADLQVENHRLSVTYFRETLNSGFRNATQVLPFAYKKYDTQSVNGSQLQGPPELAALSWTADTLLRSYGQVTNGSALWKEGVEFQLFTPRFRLLATRLTVNGAWFRTTYKNSEPVFSAVSKVIGQTALSDKYIGYYDYTDGSEKQQFNTTFILDTHLEALKLTFSVWAECMWFSSTRRFRQQGTPIAYVDVSGELQPYTEADREDVYKQWLVKTFNEELFRKTTEPFYMYLNFKAAKDFGSWLNLSVYVDRILDYAPAYESNGYTIRRHADPYFGMELTLKF